MSVEQKELIIALRDQGMHYNDIARIAKVSEAFARTVYSRANRSRKPIVNNDDLCRCCGAKLIHLRGKKKKLFCSEKCRYDWHNQQKKHKPYERICEYCGKEFVSIGYPNKRFCSRECNTMARRDAKRHEQ